MAKTKDGELDFVDQGPATPAQSKVKKVATVRVEIICEHCECGTGEYEDRDRAEYFYRTAWGAHTDPFVCIRRLRLDINELQSDLKALTDQVRNIQSDVSSLESRS